MEKICELKHKEIEDKFKTTEKRLDDHGERIKTQEQKSERFDERLDNLIRQLESLNSVMRWFIGLLIGSFVAFFFYSVQNKLF